MRLHGTATLVASLLTVATLSAQSPAAKFVDSARVEIDRAVLASDTARLARAEILLDRALVVFPNDPWLLHYRGYAAFRHALVRFHEDGPSSAASFVNLGIEDLTLSSDKLKWPETYSLLAALTSFQIAIDPSRARELGAQIGAISAQALAAGPSNPRVLLMAAEGAEKTPPEYGGGVDRARTYAKQAAAAFANDRPAPLAPAWGREELAETMKRLDLSAPAKP